MSTESAAESDRIVVRSITRVEGEDWASMSTSCFCHRLLVALIAADTVLVLYHYQDLVFEEKSRPIDLLEIFRKGTRDDLLLTQSPQWAL